MLTIRETRSEPCLLLFANGCPKHVATKIWWICGKYLSEAIRLKPTVYFSTSLQSNPRQAAMTAMGSKRPSLVIQLAFPCVDKPHNQPY
jgi:hypothetical protein